MPTIGRKVGECITFVLPDGQQVVVRVQATGHRKAELQCHAPKDILIRRGEVGADCSPLQGSLEYAQQVPE